MLTVKKVIRTGKRLLSSKKLPKPLVAVLAIGLMPIPGPVDEVFAVVGFLIAFLFYRSVVLEAWRLES